MSDFESEEPRRGADRRQRDRRVAQLPFEGPDRRHGPRRSGTDRRAVARLRLMH